MTDTIRIGAIDYTIKRVERLLADDGRTKLNGQIAYNDCTIQLDQGLSEQAERQTLWHEILHGICRQSGLNLKEETIDVLAYGVMGALRDNPWLTGQAAYTELVYALGPVEKGGDGHGA